MCGIFGVWGVENASEYVYLGLHNLQHRGQESCGIVSLTKDSDRAEFKFKYGRGIVNDVFRKKHLYDLNGSAAIGHVRYSTQGGSSMKNAQPLLAETRYGEISLAHNGQIANYEYIKKELKEKGTIFGTGSDSEVILHSIGNSQEDSLEDALKSSFKKLMPSYSIILLTKNELIGMRDPAGNRPLSIGRLPNGKGYALSSESVAFDSIGAEYIDEVSPGEMVIINDCGMIRKNFHKKLEREQRCIFEYIYFSRPDSSIFGESFSVCDVQKEFGRELARNYFMDGDVVIPVPDSSIHAALGYSEESGIPFDFGLIRSHYIGRTFIEPTQAVIEGNLVKKFNANRSVIENKRVIMVDDSIIRGNTMKKIVSLLRKFGAKEIHVRISSPPYTNPCYLGIETSEKERLIAHRFMRKSKEEIEENVRKFIEADSLKYLSIEEMLQNRFIQKNRQNYCTFCFDGKEVIPKE